MEKNPEVLCISETDTTLLIHYVKVKSLSHVQFFATPWTMQYTVHGILQARILEWVAFPFSKGSSPPRKWTGVSCIAGRFLTELWWKP